MVGEGGYIPLPVFCAVPLRASPLALPLGELSAKLTERVFITDPLRPSLRSDTSPKGRGKDCFLSNGIVQCPNMLRRCAAAAANELRAAAHERAHARGERLRRHIIHRRAVVPNFGQTRVRLCDDRDGCFGTYHAHHALELVRT